MARRAVSRSHLPATSAAVLAAALLVAQAVPAQQQPHAVRLRGLITAIEGGTLTVKVHGGETVRLQPTQDAAVFILSPARREDIAPGMFIGVGAAPLPDGTQRAIQVTIFAEAQRGLGEGHRPWDRPNTTMTNATVTQIVKSVAGEVLMVSYRGGEKTIVVPPEATVRRSVIADRSALKPGVNIGVTRALRQGDGSFVADRINVGHGGIVP